jgi:pimeloyl-ACP methyl ester carboxylesterase
MKNAIVKYKQILFLSFFAVLSFFVLIEGISYNNFKSVYSASPTPLSFTSSNSSLPDNNQSKIQPQTNNTQKIKVGDIDIAYKKFGKGDPILLIPGFAMTMEEWGPIQDKLAENHTVIIFDNRGIGKTTAGNHPFSLEQFANDTAGLIDALKIDKPVDIVGLSLGGFIEQEVALLHPEKVNHLILIGSSCGGKESLPPQLTPEELQKMQTGTANSTLFLHALFPDEWLKENINNLTKNISFFQGISQESLLKYGEAGAKWKGTCSSLANIDKPVLVMTGAQDITSPPINSLLLAEKIPGAWLVQIQGGGHGVTFQYPEKVGRILDTFLSTTS